MCFTFLSKMPQNVLKTWAGRIFSNRAKMKNANTTLRRKIISRIAGALSIYRTKSQKIRFSQFFFDFWITCKIKNVGSDVGTAVGHKMP